MSEQFYSQNWLVGDGETTVWGFSFAGARPDAGDGTQTYLNESDVYVDLVDYMDGLATRTPANFQFGPGPAQVTVEPPIPDGQEFVIYRSTPVEFPITDYTDFAQLSENDLDRSARQSLFAAQEALDITRSFSFTASEQLASDVVALATTVATDVAGDVLDSKVNVGNVGLEIVTTATGTQTVAGALDSRVTKDEVGSEEVITSTGEQTLEEALDSRVIYVDTIANLKALDTGGLVDGQTASVQGAKFLWVSGNVSSEIDDDVFFDKWVAPASDPSGANGAWQFLQGVLTINRPLQSKGDLTIYCDPINGDDANDGLDVSRPLQSLQAACNRVPLILSHNYVIDLTTSPELNGNPLPYVYDEDIRTPAFIGDGPSDTLPSAPARQGRLNITGNPTSPSDVHIGSVALSTCSGVSSPALLGVRILRDSLWNDEGGGVFVFGGGEAAVWDIEFAPGVLGGVLSYGAKANVRRVDVTNIEHRAFLAKRGARMTVYDAFGTFDPTQGTPSISAVYFATEDSKIVHYRNEVVVEPTGTLYDGVIGYVITDGDADKQYAFTDQNPIDSAALMVKTATQSIPTGTTNTTVTWEDLTLSNFVKNTGPVLALNRFNLDPNRFYEATFTLRVTLPGTGYRFEADVSLVGAAGVTYDTFYFLEEENGISHTRTLQGSVVFSGGRLSLQMNNRSPYSLNVLPGSKLSVIRIG